MILAIYNVVMMAFLPLASLMLNYRVKNGKENPDRFTEKQGLTNIKRPDGELIWMHAVGLGEVLSLRALIKAMLLKKPNLNFLVTSTTKISAEAFAKHIPDRTIHQFLPLDILIYNKRFLTHWRPNLAIFAEQDFWPGFVAAAQKTGINVALINCRISNDSAKKRMKLRPLYQAMLSKVSFVSAQDQTTAKNLEKLGYNKPICVTPSLKSGAPKLNYDETELRLFRGQINERFTWCVASSHFEDDEIAIKCAVILSQNQFQNLLIIAPRDIKRAIDIKKRTIDYGLTTALRSSGEHITDQTQIYIADTFGEMGLWYSLAQAVVIGGSFNNVQGHNPWEAIPFFTAIFHGPNINNFASDYASLNECLGCYCVESSEELSVFLRSNELKKIAINALNLFDKNTNHSDFVSETLLNYVIKR